MPRHLLTVSLIAVEFLGLAPLSSFAALLPSFVDSWAMTSGGAGLVNGMYYLGYMLAVPLLMSWTDRIDAKRILAGGLLLSAFGNLGFAGFADGLVSAMVWRGLGGVGLAALYMPGLKALTDRLAGGEQTRSVTIYTASYSVGVGFSYLLPGLIEPSFGWRAAFAVAGLLPLFGLPLVWLLPAHHPVTPAVRRPILDLRVVLTNPTALAFVLAYGAHSFELAAMRSWITAFLDQVTSWRGIAVGGWVGPTAIAALVTVIGLPGSVLGNELALRIGRRRALVLVMILSALVGLAMPLAGWAGYGWAVALALVYAFTLTADSGALTAGVVAATAPTDRGATLAVHSTVGFGASFFGPLLFGFALDLGGGMAVESAWPWAFAVAAAGVVLGPVALRLVSAKPPDDAA